MSNGFYNVPKAKNEVVKSYKKNSSELNELIKEYKNLYKKHIDIPMYIGQEKVYTKDKEIITLPHNHKHSIGTSNYGGEIEVKDAIEAAMEARKKWSAMKWEDRASIFLKGADLLAGPYRAKMNAATMLCQSKNVYQAEIDQHVN